MCVKWGQVGYQGSSLLSCNYEAELPENKVEFFVIDVHFPSINR